MVGAIPSSANRKPAWWSRTATIFASKLTASERAIAAHEATHSGWHIRDIALFQYGNQRRSLGSAEEGHLDVPFATPAKRPAGQTVMESGYLTSERENWTVRGRKGTTRA